MFRNELFRKEVPWNVKGEFLNAFVMWELSNDQKDANE